MSEPKYSEAIKSGLKLTWQHKNLWFYGFFISILGQFGIFDFLSKMILAARGEVPTSLFWHFYSSVSGIEFSSIYLSVSQWSWLIWFIVFLIAFLVSFLYIAIVSQGAIIHNAALYFDKKKIESSSKSWHHSRKYFWEILFLNLIRKVVLFFVTILLVLFLAKILFLNIWWTNLFFVLLFLLVSIFGSIVSFLTIYATCYVIIDNKDIKKAILSAWVLFKKHWLVSLEVGLIMILANLFLFALVILGLYIFLIPSILIMLSLIFSLNTFLTILIILLGVFIFTFYLIFISSLFNVFNVSTWTFLFIKMHRDGIISKFLSWFKK